MRKEVRRTKLKSITSLGGEGRLHIRDLMGVSPSEIIRQAVALRAALLARDGSGEKVKAMLTYIDDAGRERTVDLEQHVGIGGADET